MNILNKVNINVATYLLLFLSTITGQFRIVTYILVLLTIHEVGHIIAAKIFKWKITKINILPFGGNIIFDSKLNSSSKQEAIITIMGPIFQLLGTILLLKLPFISVKEAIQIKNMSYSILLFNLLPIIPLDGSKLLFIVMNNITSYNKSHICIIYISIIVTILLIVNNISNFSSQIIIYFIIYKIYNEYKNHNNLINRFILERYLYPKKYKSLKIIKGKNPNLIWKNKTNIFVHNNKYIAEKELLNNYFKTIDIKEKYKYN